jgi:hypothetical protein
LPTTGQGGSGTSSTASQGTGVPAAVQNDLNQAQIDYANAQTALQQGQLGQYQEDIAAMENQILAAAKAAAAASGSKNVTTTTTTVPKSTKPKAKSSTRTSPSSTQPRATTTTSGSSTSTTQGSAAAH